MPHLNFIDHNTLPLSSTEIEVTDQWTAVSDCLVAVLFYLLLCYGMALGVFNPTGV